MNNNPFLLAQQSRIEAALVGPLDRPKTFEGICQQLDAIHAEALANAAAVIDTLPQGDLSLEYVQDMMDIVHAVEALWIRK
ncbi:hypothetical protein [Kocuria sp.]|uniref:hypothetical protein n=1 Tax=Kocuria sp. TaxID=1871328 RepID=UPI0026E07C8B|nr:hypothetical protein [Kocuria sp.]MDO5619314.1 hypothetical protein [Kocuria sp.]